MHTITRSHRDGLVLTSSTAVLLAFLLVAASFAIQGHTGFNAWDEGFLWDGVQQTMRGGVPIRDFMAYDVGRYYWTAPLMTAMGDNGIVALRLAVALFQMLGLAIGIFWLARSTRQTVVVLLGAVILWLWMFPRHKLFDCSLSIMLVASVAWMIESPSARRYFVGGACLGLVAVFGQNHGLYGALGMVAAIAIDAGLNRGPAFGRGLAQWIAGIIVGYSPMLLLSIYDTGFLTAFIDGIRLLFEYQSTNLLPLPVPWPWTVAVTVLPWPDALRGILVGALFLGLPLFAIAGGVVLARNRGEAVRRSPLFAACVLLALPYAHFAYSRADIGHLAQGIFPVLIGLLCWPARASGMGPAARLGMAGALAAISLAVAVPQHPAYAARRDPGWTDAAVGRDVLHVDPQTAGQLAFVGNLHCDGRIRGRSDVLIVPFLVGLYPAFGLQSPVWETYALFRRSATFQQAEIARLRAAGVRVAVIQDIALDGREELRYANTHPLIYQYLRSEFVRQDMPGAPPSIDVLARPPTDCFEIRAP